MICWRKKKKIVLLYLLLFAVGLSGCAMPAQTETGHADVQVLRLATDLPENSQGYRQLERFQQILAEQSKQKIIIKLYAKDEWGESESFLEYLQLESLEMACLSTAQLSAAVPAYEIYDLPYLFPMPSDVAAYADGSKGAEALALLETQGYQGVGFVGNGYDYFLQNRASIADDINHWSGLTMGNIERPLQQQSLQAIGIRAVSGQAAESAFEARHVDGAEVQRLIQLRVVNESTYLNDPQMFYQLHMVLTQKDWWNALSEEDQQLITNSLQSALQSTLQDEQKTPLMTQFADGGITVDPVSTALKSSLTNATRGITDRYMQSGINVLAVQWQAVRSPVETTIPDSARTNGKQVE